MLFEVTLFQTKNQSTWWD